MIVSDANEPSAKAYRREIMRLNRELKRTEPKCEKHFKVRGLLICPICLADERDALRAENKRRRELLKEINNLLSKEDDGTLLFLDNDMVNRIEQETKDG